jgi:hypothetical protein
MSLELYINIFENNYNTSLLNYLQNLENRQDYYDLIEYLKINMSTTIKQQIVIDVSSLTDTIESSDLSIYYKKTWTKLNNIHKILKLKEFVNNSILNNSKKNELIILLRGDEVYRTKGILFQRWNHIVVNSEDSKIDLFVNNNLVGTYKYTNIIPKIQNQDENINQIGNVSVVNLYDTLNIGSRENINFGSICNFRYYNTILDLSKIKSIYTKYNKKNPPL